MGDMFVNIGQIRVQKDNGSLLAIGLGSCVGLALYDSSTKIGGMAHIFLPTDKRGNGKTQPGKFADTAIPALLKEMQALGAHRRNILAKMAGGSQIFSGGNCLGDIGKQNVAMVQNQLKIHGVPLVGSNVFGSKGRKMIFYVDTGKVIISSIGKEETEL